MIPTINTWGTFILGVVVVACGFFLLIIGVIDFTKAWKGEPKKASGMVLGFAAGIIGAIMVVLSGDAILNFLKNSGSDVPKF